MKFHTERQPIPMVTLTRHASCRAQQRSIPEAVIELLLDFGEATYAGFGADRYTFSKRNWRAVAAHLGLKAKHYERYRSAYIVIAANCVITVGWFH